MGLKLHLQLRMGLMFVGFFGGGILRWAFAKHLGALDTPMFLILPFVCAFLLPHAFAQLVPATCPKCGGPSLPGKRDQGLYTCRNCNAESNALLTLFEKIPTLASVQDAPQEKAFGFRLIALILLALGLVLYVVLVIIPSQRGN